MNLEAHEKVSAEQLNKEAYLYVRQSTLRQVVENTESTERQYALRQRAIALGWPDDRIVVIDSDLGQSCNGPRFFPMTSAGSFSPDLSDSFQV